MLRQKWSKIKRWDYFYSRFKFSFGYAALTYNGLKGANTDFFVIRYGNGNSSLRRLFLHHYMTAPSAHFLKTMLRQNRADIFAGENA